MLHQLLVGHGADRVLDVGAAGPGQPRPVASHLDPDLGAVVGLGQAPLKTRGPVTWGAADITLPLWGRGVTMT